MKNFLKYLFVLFFLVCFASNSFAQTNRTTEYLGAASQEKVLPQCIPESSPYSANRSTVNYSAGAGLIVGFNFGGICSMLGTTGTMSQVCQLALNCILKWTQASTQADCPISNCVNSFRDYKGILDEQNPSFAIMDQMVQNVQACNLICNMQINSTTLDNICGLTQCTSSIIATITPGGIVPPPPSGVGSDSIDYCCSITEKISNRMAMNDPNRNGVMDWISTSCKDVQSAIDCVSNFKKNKRVSGSCCKITNTIKKVWPSGGDDIEKWCSVVVSGDKCFRVFKNGGDGTPGVKNPHPPKASIDTSCCSLFRAVGNGIKDVMKNNGADTDVADAITTMVSSVCDIRQSLKQCVRNLQYGGPYTIDNTSHFEGWAKMNQDGSVTKIQDNWWRSLANPFNMNAANVYEDVTDPSNVQTHTPQTCSFATPGSTMSFASPNPNCPPNPRRGQFTTHCCTAMFQIYNMVAITGGLINNQNPNQFTSDLLNTANTGVSLDDIRNSCNAIGDLQTCFNVWKFGYTDTTNNITIPPRKKLVPQCCSVFKLGLLIPDNPADGGDAIPIAQLQKACDAVGAARQCVRVFQFGEDGDEDNGIGDKKNGTKKDRKTYEANTGAWGTVAPNRMRVNPDDSNSAAITPLANNDPQYTYDPNANPPVNGMPRGTIDTTCCAVLDTAGDLAQSFAQEFGGQGAGEKIPADSITQFCNATIMAQQCIRRSNFNPSNGPIEVDRTCCTFASTTANGISAFPAIQAISDPDVKTAITTVGNDINAACTFGTAMSQCITNWNARSDRKTLERITEPCCKAYTAAESFSFITDWLNDPNNNPNAAGITVNAIEQACYSIDDLAKCIDIYKNGGKEDDQGYKNPPAKSIDASCCNVLNLGAAIPGVPMTEIKSACGMAAAAQRCARVFTEGGDGDPRMPNIGMIDSSCCVAIAEARKLLTTSNLSNITVGDIADALNWNNLSNSSVTIPNLAQKAVQYCGELDNIVQCYRDIKDNVDDIRAANEGALNASSVVKAFFTAGANTGTGAGVASSFTPAVGANAGLQISPTCCNLLMNIKPLQWKGFNASIVDVGIQNCKLNARVNIPNWMQCAAVLANNQGNGLNNATTPPTPNSGAAWVNDINQMANSVPYQCCLSLEELPIPSNLKANFTNYCVGILGCAKRPIESQCCNLLKNAKINNTNVMTCSVGMCPDGRPADPDTQLCECSPNCPSN
jgi:hypothetical protein